MRLSFAVPAMAGLLLGWGALAHADAPPAAPIFYCPAPGKPAPTATPAAPTARAPHVVRAAEHRHQGCPTLRVAAASRHRWREHEHAQRVLANNDVSASQAFIYRYERAIHGFDARAADEAWAEGRHPPCPHGIADHCPGDRRHDGAMEGPALAEREVPPPPCPHHCPSPEGWRHAGAADDHLYAAGPPIDARPLPEPTPPREAWRPTPPEQAPPRLAEQRPMPPPTPSRPPVHAYAWQDAQGGGRYEARQQDSERAGGWSYSESDGRGQYRHWGDHFAGEPAFADRADGRHDDGGDHHWAQPHYRCPPPVPAGSCSAGPDAPIRHSDVAVAGRDAAGFLTWPGKTE